MAKKKVDEPIAESGVVEAVGRQLDELAEHRLAVEREFIDAVGGAFAAFHQLGEDAHVESKLAVWEALPDGRYATTNGGVREFRLQVDGVTYEHVDETADGRWIYSVVR